MKFAYPFSGNVAPSQLFGENPDFYSSMNLAGHNGIDFPLPVGTEILAVDAGRVLWVKMDEEGFGLHVKIEHPHGWSLYAHLSEVSVQADASVQAGSVIGLSGNTGMSTGPHLHFGYKPKDYDDANGYFGYIDPQPFLCHSQTS